MSNERPGSDADNRSMMDNIKLGGGIAGGAFLVLFLAQNFEDASINILWFEATMPLFFALLIAAALGAVATLTLGFFRRRARRVERRENRRD